MKKSFINFFLYLLYLVFLMKATASSSESSDSDSSSNDSDEICDADEMIRYLFNNQEDLLAVSPFVVSEGVDEAVIFKHVIDIEFSEPYNLENMSVSAFFELLDGEKHSLAYTAVAIEGVTPYTMIQISIPHTEFTSLNIQSSEGSDGTVTHSAPLVISFYNECEEHVMKNYVFDFSVNENSHFSGNVGLVSNDVRDTTNNCVGDTGCASSIKYDAKLNIMDETFSTILDPASLEFYPGQKMYLEFKIKQDVSSEVTITSIKEAAPTGIFAELIDNSFATEIIHVSPGTVRLKVMVMMAQSFTLLLEAQLVDSPEDSQRLLEENGQPPMHALRRYYAGKHIQVIKDGTATAADSSPGAPRTVVETNSTYQYLFYGCVLLFAIFGGCRLVSIIVKNRNTKEDKRKLMDQKERSDGVQTSQPMESFTPVPLSLSF